MFIVRSKILCRGVGRSRGMNRIGWRCLLTAGRCWYELWWCSGEGVRRVATRRHTSGTDAVMQTDYLEKSGCFMVKIRNNCRVFRCSVNWARARLTLTRILGSDALASSRIWSVCHSLIFSMPESLTETDSRKCFHFRFSS